MSEPKRLNIQWGNLFPAETLKIGDESVAIKPMSFKCLASVLAELKGFISVLKDNDIMLSEEVTPADMITIATILVGQFPDVLSKASNIHVDDIAEMPLDIVVELLATTVTINLKSKESLLKNFKALRGLLPQVEETEEETEEEIKELPEAVK